MTKLKWLLVATLIAVPALGFAVTKYHARSHCTHGCPLKK